MKMWPEPGPIIKEYLEEFGMTQAFLSRETGIDTCKLNLALNGRRKLSLNEYSLICGALKVDTNFFLKPRLPDRKERKEDVAFKVETKEYRRKHRGAD